jgi:hypothetical protein
VLYSYLLSIIISTRLRAFLSSKSKIYNKSKIVPFLLVPLLSKVLRYCINTYSPNPTTRTSKAGKSYHDHYLAPLPLYTRFASHYLRIVRKFTALRSHDGDLVAGRNMGHDLPKVPRSDGTAYGVVFGLDRREDINVG